MADRNGNLVIIRSNSDSATIFRVNKNSFYSPRGVGNNPISVVPGDYKDNVKRFDEGVSDLYGGNSRYATGGPFFSFGFREPYVWTSLNDSNFKKYIKLYDSQGFPIGSAIQDTERISKFSVSGRGVWWLLKQQFLHQQNPHDEANIVDPTSQIVSAFRPTTLGLIPRVTKHISGGSAIGGLLSLVGVSIGEPKSTAGVSALPTYNQDGEHIYGLLRGKTTKEGRKNLRSAWMGDNQSSNFFSVLTDSLKDKFLGSFLAAHPNYATTFDGDTFRGDQNTYDMMQLDSFKQSGKLDTGYVRPVTQVGSLQKYFDTRQTNSSEVKSGDAITVFSVANSERGADSYKFPVRRLDVPITTRKPSSGVLDNPVYYNTLAELDSDEQKNSIMIIRYNEFLNDDILTISKGTDDSVFNVDKNSKSLNENYKQFLSQKFGFEPLPNRNYFKILSNSGEGSIPSSLRNESGEKTGRYSDYIRVDVNQNVDTSQPADAWRKTLINNNGLPRDTKHSPRYSVNIEQQKYISDLNTSVETAMGNNLAPNYLTQANYSQLINNNEGGYGKFGRSRLTNDGSERVSDLSREKYYNMGDYGLDKKDAGKSVATRRDKLNYRGVVTGNEDGSLPNDDDLNDFIRFQFHDIMNNQYILFRATLKGISDSYNADWQDIKYLGRADRLYTYNGHTRDLSFNFRVYATSKAELRPMWEKINYLTGLTEPSVIKGYESFKVNLPPFFKITIGDMIIKQPALFKTIGVNVPDEASWELDEGIQYPMMVELSVSATILNRNPSWVARNRYGDINDYEKKSTTNDFTGGIRRNGNVLYKISGNSEFEPLGPNGLPSNT